MKPKSLWMLSDDVKDTVADVRHMGNFLLQMGKEWKKNRAQYYKTMPETFLRMLDELADVMVCEHGECRELVHPGWDFCKVHGKARS